MSFNVRVQTTFDVGNHWMLRRDLLVQTIRRFNPDLLGTQEALASQTSYLRKELPEYEFVGVGRNDGKRRGEMCAIFYRPGRFRKLDEGWFWLSNTPEKPGSKSWGSFFPRMVTWVKLQPRNGQAPFYYFNTHLEAFSAHARKEEAKLLRGRIDKIARGAPVVVSGDFNAGEGTEPYRIMTRRSDRSSGRALVDTLRAVSPITRSNEGTQHSFRGGRNDERIDWILASADFQTLSAEIDHNHRGGRYPSDHFPVTAVLRWRPSIAGIQPGVTGG